jgi:predicted ester cyclase
VAREVTLLPRHWDWLASQQGGASVTPRKLVEQTLRSNGAADRQRTARAAAYRFMHAIAGDATGFEEASRALFSGDLRGLSQCMSAWPGDIRAHILEMLASDSAANESRGQRLQCFIDEVWNHGDASAAAKYLTPHYTIHHDPGDPWEKKTLNRAEFEERVVHSRAPFPDQRFDILQMAECAAGVMMTWTWCGTHLGDLPGFLASGRQINMSGATLYCFDDERISGHWQVTDRLGVFMQLRQGAAG